MTHDLSIPSVDIENQYPHVIGTLGESFIKAGNEIYEDSQGDSEYGAALKTVGETFTDVVGLQHVFDATVNQNFLGPVKDVLERDVKEVMKMKKKLDGRRLDYDFRNNKNVKAHREAKPQPIPDEEIAVAKDKMDETLNHLDSQMTQLINSEPEHIAQLQQFVQAHIEFYTNSLTHLTQLAQDLEDRHTAASKTKRDTPVRAQMSSYPDSDDEDNGGTSGVPLASALFDFEAENDGELSFKDGDQIKLISRLDENWLEGEIDGARGIFPSNYVNVLIEP